MERYTRIFKEDILPGGTGDFTRDEDFDPVEVSMGNVVELEHTDDVKLAKEITRDHLSEPGNERYYSRLRDAGLADELSTVG